MTSKKASRDMLLNWLVRSKKTAARVGRLPVDSGVEMYFSILSCMALTMKSLPLGAPTAQLNGRRWRANFPRKVWATWLAIRRRMAVGIPRGRSLVVSLGSLWRQKR